MVWTSMHLPVRPGANQPVPATWRAWSAIALMVVVTLGLLTALHASLPARQGTPRRAVSPPLAAVLQRFGIPLSSQVLVFSKTSLQRLRIETSNPRAIFFNDRAAVGWVPGSPLLEIAIFDGAGPGVTFQTVDTSHGETTPRRGERCFQCHALPDSGGLPGLLMRSSLVPESDAGFRCLGDIDDRTPFERRWAGWYVTGQRLATGHAGRERLPSFQTAYPRPGSDVVALLVLGHQVAAVNLINRLGRAVRLAELDEDSAQGDEARDLSAVRARVNELADYLLFLDEAALPAPIAGDPEFVAAFEQDAVRDGHGHSLRRLDLQQRLFRVPCSYMIHSAAFRALPPSARHAVYARMSTLLADADDPRVRARLSASDREAVVHILEATITELPAGFGRS